MSNFTYNLTIGIDVSADFSYAAIIEPNENIYRKSFKVTHNLKRFKYLVEEIKKAEKELSSKPAIFMESIGIYHIALFHYLKKFFNDVFIINPLITNSNKNSSIRKVKNDKKDAVSIAHIGKFQNIKYSTDINLDYYLLKSLLREYYKLKDDCSQYKKRLSTDLRVIFPNYNTIFRDTCSKASLALLERYPSPSLILDTPKNKIIELLQNKAKRSVEWCEKIYEKLVAEIGDFNRFKNSKSLVAYLGIGPSINESGNFKSSKNSMSKRGTSLGRKAIYTAALSSIGIKRNGEANNEIILEYYNNKLKSKRPKVALGAVMHKIVRYIFSVIKSHMS